MEAADSLIKSLGSEKIRWSQQSNEINETLQQAIGNAAVASGFISYVISSNPLALYDSALALEVSILRKIRSQKAGRKPNT